MDYEDWGRILVRLKSYRKRDQIVTEVLVSDSHPCYTAHAFSSIYFPHSHLCLLLAGAFF